MRIIQVAHSFIPYTFAGTEVYTYNLAKELTKEDEVVIFFRIKDFRLKEYEVVEKKIDGIKTLAINHTFNQCRSFKETYQDHRIDDAFGRLLDKFMPDCVHIQHLLFLSLGIVAEAKKRNIPVIFTLNDYWLMCHRGQFIRQDLSLCNKPEPKHCLDCLKLQLSIKGNSMYYYNILRRIIPGPALQWLKCSYLGLATIRSRNEDYFSILLKDRQEAVAKMLKEVDLFISPSHFMYNRFLEFGIPASKIRYIPHGIPYPNPNYSFANDAKNKFRFGFIGTLLPMKGVDVLLNAFSQIKNENLRLLIFGKFYPYAGYEGYVNIVRKEAKKDNRIRLVGGFDHREVGKVFSQFDCLVVPSIWPENSPLVIAEAHLHRKAVVASRIGGIPELIEDGRNGLLVTPGDVQDLKDTLQRLVDDPSVVEELRDAPFRIKSIEEHAAEIEFIYTHFRESRVAGV